MPFSNKNCSCRSTSLNLMSEVFFMCLVYLVTFEYLAISLFFLERPLCGLTLLSFLSQLLLCSFSDVIGYQVLSFLFFLNFTI